MKAATFASGLDPGAGIALGPGVLTDKAAAGLSAAKMVLMRPQHEAADDGTLVRLSLSGDGKAYELLVRRYQKLVYNVLYQMVRSHETAADLTQETFVRAFRGLAGFRAGAPFKPWLLRIATNCGLNWMRDCRLQDSLDELLEEDPGAEPVGRQDVESEVGLRLSQSLLLEALTRLPVRHRHVFLLRYQHDLSYEEIASITGDPETTIKSLLHRVRERLRRMLSDRMKAEH